MGVSSGGGRQEPRRPAEFDHRSREEKENEMGKKLTDDRSCSACRNSDTGLTPAEERRAMELDHRARLSRDEGRELRGLLKKAQQG